jgi:carbon-monoxide dehydrogenase medium subunit
MKPAPFVYYRPSSVSDAVQTLADQPFAKVLAGGQSLIPAMNFRLATPSMLVDISRLNDLVGLEVDEHGVTIGAAVTQRHVERSSRVAAVVPALAETLRWVGHVQTRNRGTVCGSLAHADPSGELSALAINSDADVTVESPRGIREATASDFIRGPFWTDLQPDEVITGIRFPAPPPGTTTRVDEIAHRSGDFATVGLVASITREGPTVTGARFTGFAVAGTPIRLPSIETFLPGIEQVDEAVGRALGEAAVANLEDPLEDIHATVEYRREALAALVVRTVRWMLRDAQEEAS